MHVGFKQETVSVKEAEKAGSVASDVISFTALSNRLQIIPVERLV